MRNFISRGLRALTVTAAAFALAAATPAVVVDGVRLGPGSTMVVRGKVYVALRPVGRALGADVSYDGKAHRVTVTTVLRQVILRMGDPVALVNGEPEQLDASAQIVNHQVALPLRALSAALGADVRYDDKARQVVVSSKVSSAPIAQGGRAQSSAASTLEGTITSVRLDEPPPTVQMTVNGVPYNVSVPEQTRVSFRDTHGGLTQTGQVSQVRPGDTLIVTLGPSGAVVSVADIYAGFNGTIASAAGTSMVLTNGKVVIGDATDTSVTLNARQASFAELKSGDLVTVRADPRTGKVRDIVALTPGGIATSATATARPGSQAGTSLRIEAVNDGNVRGLRQGQLLHVSAMGTPGARAWFDLSNFIVGNPMREVRSGRYEGEYAVQAGTNILGAPLIVRLDKDGQSVQAQASEPVDIITTPPAIKDTAPAPSSRVNNPRPNIYATFSTPGDAGMDVGSLRIAVNGKDVTAQAARTPQFVAYYPPSELSPGPATVEIRGSDAAGNAVTFQWSFVIAQR
ncbi:MAG: copper amine oxidase N-terminal domain-containing protein [Candidatus Eremiobacteraeota bacterium]|nr:copper amine oxidase N-terminal domain-containing protein [Candidatus Eremiobacteraeota bacterium]